MAAEQATILSTDYQQPWGTKRVLVVELFGPTSYATGGQLLNASQFGLRSFDAVISLGRSYSGTFDTRGAQYLAVDAAPSVAKGPVSQVRVPWYNISNAVEVTSTTNLATEMVRLLIVGN